MTLEEFKEKGKVLKQEIVNSNDTVDIEHGMMTIHLENINKYLEKYACKDAEDLEETLWNGYGVFVKVLD